MAVLVAFAAAGGRGATPVAAEAVGSTLRDLGLGYGRWPPRAIGDGSPERIRTAYREELAKLDEKWAIAHVDRVTVAPGHPGWPEMRRNFLQEHWHRAAEIRYFLGGSGLFYVRTADADYGLLCETGDWVALPAGIRHFFDAGSHPEFDVLRLFGSGAGWAAELTHAERPAWPLLDEFRQAFAGRPLP